MALLDSLKKATGLGLSPQELFERAYEKGVLLGDSAVRNPRAQPCLSQAQAVLNLMSQVAD